ncbi:type I-E CRISPR-associated protein Cas6/Cse3/CasE [Rheinheimera sp. SA_1]|uniref:type I-E CRISPR-associated protein Cas6/Cse3/CasE n=1 Tax=Rheinheimera sp. SA_1 TaxID=1827365 RepID=UPI0007FD33AF|nr:type I-E CRISPR-associated protein Cas6/Cse3/CasE [Rheinheimera sp. SA_1]OBP13646.1 type I-E CRISPR-associated protein Cas6/Cse3/CasE [Rheinheimera sp. SA_1]
MYLSRVRFWPNSAAHQALISVQQKGSYASHQLLWQLFTEQADRNFLFREDQASGLVGSQGMPEYLVLSTTAPAQLSELFQVQTKKFEPRLVVGERLAFRLRANPTVSYKGGSSDSSRGQRHDVMMHARKTAQASGIVDKQQLQQQMNQAAIDWLTCEKRSAKLGVRFEVQPTIIASSQHKTRKKSQSQLISYSAVDYEGVLTVNEPELFLTQVALGLGRAKAFGCGLMLIRRV